MSLALTVTTLSFSNKNSNFSCHFFCRGTSGIDIDLRQVDINQCSTDTRGSGVLNIFGGTDKCKTDTTKVTTDCCDAIEYSSSSYKKKTATKTYCNGC